MGKKKSVELSSDETLDRVAAKLEQLELSLRNNIPKSAIQIIIRNLARTCRERTDYTHRNF